jgi:hypothetical protein
MIGGVAAPVWRASLFLFIGFAFCQGWLTGGERGDVEFVVANSLCIFLLQLSRGYNEWYMRQLENQHFDRSQVKKTTSIHLCIEVPLEASSAGTISLSWIFHSAQLVRQRQAQMFESTFDVTDDRRECSSVLTFASLED